MKVIIVKNYQELSKKAAELVIDHLNKKSNSVLGLPTGSTSLGLYKELIKAHQKGKLDFSQVTTFNLDEYLGLSKDHPQSYNYFMRYHFFDHINIKTQNINIPDGQAKNLKKHCQQYEKKIKQSGGIDLQILGIGRNGHIGFNEPGTSFNSRTHVVNLTEDTIAANSRFFGDLGKVPTKAITMGLATIMSAKKIILLASGRAKAAAVARAIKGPITKALPASILQRHQEVTLIIDKSAAKLLKN